MTSLYNLRASLFIIMAVLLLFGARGVFAAEPAAGGKTGAAAAKPTGHKLVEITELTYHLLEGKIEGDRGGFSVSGASTGIRVWKFNFNYDVSSFSWDDPARLPFGDGRSAPWKTLKTVGFGFIDFKKISERFRYFYNVWANSGFEDEMGTWGVGGAGGVVWIFSPSLVFRLGGIGIYHPVNSWALPLVGVDYQPADKLGFSCRLGFPSTRVSYNFTPDMSVFAQLWFEQRMYNLSDNNKVRPNGYVEIIDQGAGLFWGIEPAEFMRLRFGLIYVPRRFIHLYDHDRDKHGSHDVDPSYGAAMEAKILF
ncbi:MAG: hypothetical protein V1816_06740 [Pseudomonadota bacterium]